MTAKRQMSSCRQPAEMKLRTERDVVESLAGRAVTLAELYSLCEAEGIASRDDGLAPIEGFGSDQRFKRRVRCVLQDLRKSGKAQRVAEATWVIEGPRAMPSRCLLVICGEPSHLELALADAARLLAELDGLADLVIADPPWALQRQVLGDADRDRCERVYKRDSSKVVPGYVDVPQDEYAEFTHRWVEAAAAALRPGAYLSIITGPSAAARAQVAAEDAGLNLVNQVVARRPFALKTTRRFSHAHTVITIMCSGPVTSSRRFFATPADLPLAASGVPYPLDWWPDMPKPAERPGQLRYDNSLPELLVRRCVHALTRGPENGGEPWQSLVVDPFLGGGTTAIVSHLERRRFLGGDLNPHALRYAMARMPNAECHRHAVPVGLLKSPKSTSPHSRAFIGPFCGGWSPELRWYRHNSGGVGVKPGPERNATFSTWRSGPHPIHPECTRRASHE